MGACLVPCYIRFDFLSFIVLMATLVLAKRHRSCCVLFNYTPCARVRFCYCRCRGYRLGCLVLSCEKNTQQETFHYAEPFHSNPMAARAMRRPAAFLMRGSACTIGFCRLITPTPLLLRFPVCPRVASWQPNWAWLIRPLSRLVSAFLPVARLIARAPKATPHALMYNQTPSITRRPMPT